jgi:uncharacterized protein DUF5681
MWKPGETGNPEGAKKPRRFLAALERALAQDDGKRLRDCVEKLLDFAAQGQPWAVQFLAERLDGKAEQTVSIIRDAVELSDNDLANIASGSGDRTPETPSSPKIPPIVH